MHRSLDTIPIIMAVGRFWDTIVSTAVPLSPLLSSSFGQEKPARRLCSRESAVRSSCGAELRRKQAKHGAPRQGARFLQCVVGSAVGACFLFACSCYGALPFVRLSGGWREEQSALRILEEVLRGILGGEFNDRHATRTQTYIARAHMPCTTA